MTSKQLVLDIIARDKTKAGFSSATKGAGGLRKAVGGIASGIGAIGLTAFAKDSVSTFQSATKESLALNRAVGGTVEEASRLRFAAKMTGQDLEAFTKGMGLLDKNLVRAAQTGKGPVFETMQKMGVAFTDASGKVKPLTETLPEMAEVFKNMPNGPQKTAMALQLFGRSGASLLPFLQRGKAGIEDLMGQTDQYNQVIGQEQVDAFAKNIEAQRQFDASLAGIKMTLGQDLLPAITPVIKTLGDLTKHFSDMPQWLQTATVAVGAGALAWNFFGSAIGGLGKGLSGAARMIGLTTAAVEADTIATRANTTAKTRNAGALAGIGKLNKGTVGATSSLAASGAGLAGTAKLIGGVTTAIVAGGYAYHEWIQGAQRATEGAEGLAAAAAVSGGALTDQSRAAADAWLQTNDLANTYKNLKVSADTMRSAVLGNKGAMDEVRAAIGKQASAQQQFISTGAGASAMMTSQGNTLGVLQDKLTGAFESTKQFAEAQEKLREEQQRIAEADLAAKLDQAARGFEWGSTKAHAYAKAVAEAGRAAGKSDSEIAAMLRTAGATPRQIRIAFQADPSQLDAALAESRTKLNDLKQYKKPEISARVGELNKLMDAAQARVDSLKQRKRPAPRVDVERAAADVARIQHIIDNIRNGNVTIDIKQVMHAPVGGESAPKLKKKAGATGGDLDGRVLVGERGPEFVDLPEGAHVYTASQSRGMGLENYAKGKKGKKLTAKDQKWKAKQLASLKKKRKNGWESSNTASLREALTGARETATNSFFGQAGLISGYDPNALAEAQAEAQAAQEEINSSAVGSSARASGLARLKAARQKIAEAPTSAMDWVRKRVAKMGRWSAMLGRLSKAWGGTAGGQQLLREIWEQGPDGGLELAEALEKAPGSLQEMLNGANQAMAYAGVAAEYNPDVVNAGAAYAGGQRADRDLVLTSIVQVEGIQVVKAIQKFKQSQGGRELGIA